MTLESFVDDATKLDLAEIAESADVVFVTARSLCPGSIAQEWVTDNVGDFSVISVDSWQEKLPILHSLRPKIYVDDHLQTLDALYIPDCQLITVPLPYTAPSKYLKLDINEVARRIRDEY